MKWLRQLLPTQDAAYNFKNYQKFWDDILERSDTVTDFNKIKFVTGHFHFGIGQYFGSQSGYVVVLRDPVDRVKSLIRYIRKTKGHRLHELFIKANDIAHIYTNIKHSPQISNGQVRQLCCYDLAGLICLNDAHVEKAMKQISGNNVHVFTTNELDKLLRPGVASSNIKSITHENSTEMDGTNLWLNSEGTEAVIRENNLLDIRLYDYAIKHRCTTSSVLLPYVFD